MNWIKVAQLSVTVINEVIDHERKAEWRKIV